MKYKEIREKVLEASLTSNKLGLIHGTSGNISMRDAHDPVIAITPSNIPYDQLTPEDISIVDLNGNILDGKYKPSSETPMHTAVFRARPDVMAVVHTHSLFATVMSMRMENLKRATVPSNMYYPIPTAPFEMPGSEELAQAAVKTLGKDGDVTLLKNHGLLATGPSMDAAMTCAVYTEECAQVCYYAEAIGNNDYIPEKAALTIRACAKGGNAV
ncbi:MAG: class II aldolase/adducin family protein [Eubacteriales bacterium]